MLKAPLLKFFFLIAAIGCGATSNTTHTVINDAVVNPVDTTHHDNPKENIIQSHMNENKELKVALLLPFYTNEIEYDSLGINITGYSESSSLAIQYYRGVQLALDSLDKAGVKMKVNVFDTRKDTDRVKNILDYSDVKNADVVIGPISNGELMVAQRICGARKQPVISPLSSSYNLSVGNPQFILANAGLKTHCDKISSYINSKYSSQRVLIVYRKETEASYASFFKSGLKMKTIELSEKSDSSFYHIDDFLSVINSNIIIIPSFDEEFVNLITKQLHELSANYTLEVFGMPTWNEMETLRPDYLQEINTHITSSFYVNDSSKAVLSFREKFKDEFSSRPNEYSYQGYSIFMLLGSLWKENDNRWFQHITEEENELGVSFKFQPVKLKSDEVDFLENKNVFVLQYRNNILLPAK